MNNVVDKDVGSNSIMRGLIWKIDNNVRKDLIEEHFDERDLGLIDEESNTIQASRPNLNG